MLRAISLEADTVDSRRHWMWPLRKMSSDISFAIGSSCVDFAFQKVVVL